MQLTSAVIPGEAALAALGFTDTEAGLYCALLRHGASTGYRAAQLVGKAPANAYQALAALTQKGAVLVDEGEPKTFRAARPEELLAALQGAFDQRRSQALASLAAIETAAPDDRTWQLKSAAQVLERATTMLDGARQIVLFDLFPAPFAVLAEALGRAAARGVVVAGQVYAPVEAPDGVLAVTSANAAVVRDRWPGAQLTLVADAREHLVALMTADARGLVRAAWSDSAYLGCLQHSGLSAEIRLAAQGGGADSLSHLSLLAAAPAGLSALVGPEPILSKETA
ncbi:MAG TPA: helix-turn-helix domain-containing protein [Caulobacteraceae bacterium]|nr:helix-turn-helix domain-containing protein [Caulobacteraceae bacterium]